MKKTPLGPGKAALDRGSTFSSPRTEIKRTKQPPKRSQPRRDWTAARAKVTDERICRAWLGDGCAGVVEAAHIIGRECDRFVALFSFEMETLDASTHPETTYSEWNVDPLRIVPLCTKHHRAYDRHDLDILPTLTTEEQVQAVADAGSIVTALQRTTGQRYAPESEA